MFPKTTLSGLMTATLLSLALVGCGDKDGTWETPGGSYGGGDTETETTTDIDNDGDGFLASEDCDDADSTINPAADEVCDGTDNDCDGEIDEDVMSTFYADADGDSFGDDASTAEACDVPDGYVPVGGDCDDANGDINPGADDPCNLNEDWNCDGEVSYEDDDGDGWAACEDCDDDDADINPDAEEVCDGEDNDCDGDTDENFKERSTWYADTDADGYGDEDESTQACEQPEGYVNNDDDCDDSDAATSPDGVEVCDGTDNDCNGTVDDNATDTDTYYADADEDGFGDVDSTTSSCTAPSGYVADGTDCDDADADINPDAAEVCDEVDNDCDGSTDEDATDATTFYVDSDGDGYGTDATTATACDAPSGYADSDADCDDDDAAINPDAEEVCDEIDNDCDGDTDDFDDSLTGADTWYRDLDGDGYGYADYSVESCDQPSNYVADDTDCDDTEASANPDAEEVCDEIDNDCDGETDESDAGDVTTWYADTDGDGYGTPDDSQDACQEPEGYVASDEDCDDDDSLINPDADEQCDEVDNNCDGEVDEDAAADALTWYADADEDSYGDPDTSTVSCEAPSGYVEDFNDCDDADADQNPDADEVCNGEDDNCNGDTDEDAATDVITWYADTDGDGFGDQTSPDIDCDQPSGYVEDDTDCDDGASEINPDATEVCDGVDNNCDAEIDEDTADDAATWYADSDEDSFGDADDSTAGCNQPEGYVSDDTDCDDDDEGINPGADELCDEIDNNCDGETDEDSAADAPTWYADDDEDGFGDPDTATQTCETPSGYVSDDQDCDDTDGNINPTGVEECDGADNDCDGTTDEDDAIDASTWYQDLDSDGFGDEDSTTVACDEPSGYTDNDTDCVDSNAAINPDADEECDNIDNDCDGDVDEDDAADAATWYADDDGDGYGNSSDSTSACAQPAGYVTDDTDCDDANNDVNPGEDEVCNDIDDDCNGDTDDDDSGLDTATATTWYGDDDGDDYGETSDTALTCDAPSGYVAAGDDCDDGNSSVNPDAEEVCDEVDNNCDGEIDEDSATDATTWYGDNDGDGYGYTTFVLVQCEQPSNYVENDEDCDDLNSSSYPGASEVCDGEDNDCDGTTDEGATSTFYADSDGDGFGDSSSTTEECSAPGGYVEDDTDCDDSNGDVNPDATEVCDDADNNCDGSIDEDTASDATTWYIDADEDGYGDSDTSTVSCDGPSGYVEDDTDCNDAASTINPGADEVCNSVDDDCNGDTDDADVDLDTTTGDTFYLDDDGDEYGDPDSTIDACELPEGYVDNDEDCDDSTSAINPGAEELCNEIDDDCDGNTDDGTLGGTATCAAESCAEIMDAGDSTGDGAYYLDPTGSGTAELYECDMSTDGGGWTQIIYWNREDDSDTQADFESLWTENYNNMGKWQSNSSNIAWNDGNSNADAMDYDIDVDVPNDGETLFELDYYGYSMEDSALFWYITNASGTEENLYCQTFRSGSSSYSSTEQSYIPGYTCSLTATGDINVDTTTQDTMSDEVVSFHLSSFHYDNGTGDYSYLYHFGFWVR